ncbi:MAG: aldo/keto reductase [Acidobacteriia bacterium]|nr:aldo/keto reductase [Terriglobia bacterium]
MAQVSRRGFLKSTLAGAALAGTGGSIPAFAQKKSATDWVTLGNSGVKVTRLAFGSGTFSGRVQRQLGQEEFTKLVRYAYDHGIRFFETAEGYSTPAMLGTALKGLPRDSIRIMTKFGIRPGMDAEALRGKFDRARTDLQTEYFDIVLMHCMRTPTWRDDTKSAQDGLSEAKAKKVVLAHGASVHGLPALAGFPGHKWLDVALLRINHTGVRMDTPDARDTNDLGDVNKVVAAAKQIHAQGTGVLGMKLAGEGRFTNAEDRRAALKFVMDLGAVDAVTIGYKSTAEIDEAMENMNRALNG